MALANVKGADLKPGRTPKPVKAAKVPQVKAPLPMVEYDVYEKNSKIAQKLLDATGIQLREKNAETWVGNYSPTADFVITDKSGAQWGIERKSFSDCINSIRDGRVYGQLAQLMVAYPGRAILLIEDADYIPKALARNPQEKNRLRESVHTFANEQSMLLPVWRSNSAHHAARMVAKWAKTAHERETRGRGIRVILDPMVR